MAEKDLLYGCSPLEAYRIQDKLGEGTFGQVHRGTHVSTGTSVALKEIILHNKDDGMPITALREIRILKSLDHPNVIELLDMAVKKGNRQQRRRASFYMITPYMDHDMAGLLQNPKVRLTIPHIKCYMTQLLEGIDYLHQQKYMHRDIKAANILLDNQGRVKLADFGLARKYFDQPPTIEGAPAATTKYTATVVTRWYRPPELLLGEQYYTTAVDMWGIGCVFGEIFLRKPIFPGKSDQDQIFTIFKVTGSPTEEATPYFKQLPGGQVLSSTPYDRKFDEFFEIVPSTARSLLSGLLCLDPLKRLSAQGALAHEFFTTGPPMASLNELPIYTSSHELTANRNREQRASEQNQNRMSLPNRPDGRMNRDSWDNRRQSSGGGRRKALGFKLNNRPILRGIELIPPYRREEYKKRTAEDAGPESEPANGQSDNKRFKPETLDY